MRPPHRLFVFARPLTQFLLQLRDLLVELGDLKTSDSAPGSRTGPGSSESASFSAARMKAKRGHRVPLRRRAVEILDGARTLGDGSPRVFRMRSGEGDLRVDAAQDALAASDRGRGARLPVVVAELGGRGDRSPAREVIEAALAQVARTRARRPTRGRTCSNGDASSWTIGWRTLVEAAAPGTKRSWQYVVAGNCG